MWQSSLETWSLCFVMMFIVKLLFTLQRKRGRAATLGRGKFLLYCSLEASIEATIFAFMMFGIFFIDENDLMFGDFDFNLLTFLVVIGCVVAISMILRNLPYIRDALANLEEPPKAATSE
jgi:hypothetical protein